MLLNLLLWPPRPLTRPLTPQTNTDPGGPGPTYRDMCKTMTSASYITQCSWHLCKDADGYIWGWSKFACVRAHVQDILFAAAGLCRIYHPASCMDTYTFTNVELFLCSVWSDFDLLPPTFLAEAEFARLSGTCLSMSFQVEVRIQCMFICMCCVQHIVDIGLVLQKFSARNQGTWCMNCFALLARLLFSGSVHRLKIALLPKLPAVPWFILSTSILPWECWAWFTGVGGELEQTSSTQHCWKLCVEEWKPTTRQRPNLTRTNILQPHKLLTFQRASS